MSGKTTEGEEIRDIVTKFRQFKMNSEYNERELNEARIMIELLQEELNISKETEQNLRSTISSVRSRLLQLQGMFGMFIQVDERQKENEERAGKIERKVDELAQMVKEFEEKIRALLKSLPNDIKIMEDNLKLKSLLESKNCDYDLLRIDIQILTKEKKDLLSQYHTEVNNLEKEVQKLQLENTKLKSQYEQQLYLYRKQVKDDEQIIKEYERERKSLLEEFDFPKGWDQNFVSADGTFSMSAEERASSQQKSDGHKQLFQSSSSPKPLRCKREKTQQFLRQGGKKKPQLDFLVSPEGSQASGPESPPKRRLFSNNSNYYVS